MDSITIRRGRRRVKFTKAVRRHSPLLKRWSSVLESVGLRSKDYNKWMSEINPSQVSNISEANQKVWDNIRMPPMFLKLPHDIAERLASVQPALLPKYTVVWDSLGALGNE